MSLKVKLRSSCRTAMQSRQPAQDDTPGLGQAVQDETDHRKSNNANNSQAWRDR